jgi:hypothetical protein
MMNEYAEQSRDFPHPTREQMDTAFSLCRTDQWASVLQCVHENPWTAMTPMIMDNHISTTILHQAITSKGDTAVRAQVILKILDTTPMAASIKNGYGSLPLHVIAQRNTKMNAQTKEKLILAMVNAYKGALMEEGGVGKRTPLHIIFTGTNSNTNELSRNDETATISLDTFVSLTDYISPRVTGMMIEHGSDACFMGDKKGYLPAHVACSRHCSPEKLRMLLSVNPASLYERTNKGETLLSLATSTATKSHPNYALIDELNRQLHISQDSSHAFASLAAPVSAEESDGSSRGRLDSNETVDPNPNPCRARAPGRKSKSSDSDSTVEPPRKRKPSDSDDSAVNPPPADVDLLLHFSRNGSTRTSLDDEYAAPSRIAQV